jgi:DNA invertase Pin-like site-specific DNA recombinase
VKAHEHQKVTANHLKRNAYLYVRQSTVRQVFENTESTKRQYALRQRAIALGWPTERIVVIDNDLGRSGASTADRKGFQELVAEVGIGKAGIVMGLEVSRLARNSTDWHRLLEICALTETLILDEDGLYDPQHFNDRLLLGLKGTMSEAELHLLRARLRGGLLNKAKRGELRTSLPVGLVYDSKGQVALDPDKQVQEALRLFFQTFRRTGSAMGAVKAFRRKGILFPRRLLKGPRKGELLWDELLYSRALQILHNPRYAGAFAFGRMHTRRTADGKKIFQKLPQEEWHALLPDSHEGYISWQEYEENQRRLQEMAQARGGDRRKSPPREGPALLQGLVMCGVCGQRMTVRYHTRNGELAPDYACQRKGHERGEPSCQHVPGADVDEAVGNLLMETMTPLALEVTLAVQEELQSRLEEADRLRYKQVERARYESELARRRFMQVDPENRLVADELEADWNAKLRVLADAQEDYERKRQDDRLKPNEEQNKQVLALTTDFPALWRDPKTPQRERKRMLRLLIEDATLLKDKQITVHVRFRSGATKTLVLPLPERFRTPPSIIQEIDTLLDHHTDAGVAAILNERGRKSGHDLSFHGAMVGRIRYDYGLKGYRERLRQKGMLTLKEMAEDLGVAICTVRKWHERGLIEGHPCNDRNECLYEPPSDHSGGRIRARNIREKGLIPRLPSQPPKEVQYET